MIWKCKMILNIIVLFQFVSSVSSGERPLGDVLLCKEVVEVSSQSAHRHRSHVTGAAVWKQRQEKDKTGNKPTQRQRGAEFKNASDIFKVIMDFSSPFIRSVVKPEVGVPQKDWPGRTFSLLFTRRCSCGCSCSSSSSPIIWDTMFSTETQFQLGSGSWTRS